LTVLKLLSFYDRSSWSNKDAKDLIFIIDHYWEAGNKDRLYDEENQDILEEEEFTLPVASARLLGRDIAKIVDENLKNKLLEILENETDDKGHFQLLSQVIPPYSDSENSFEQILNQPNALKKGLKEG